jgi:CubicO group peptidase (beta-lactamase class C family)
MSYKFEVSRLKVSAAMLLLLVFQLGFAQDFQELNDLVEQKQKLLKTDIVLTVANKDTIVYNKDSKLFSSVRGQAPIGASSEWLTAALVMLLADEGKISLDDKISRYLPEFGRYGKGYITIRQCLSHFTGIQAEGGKLKKMFEKKKFASLEEEINSFAAREIQRNPGEEFRYNHMGISIAGRVLEVVSKKRFDMLAQQRLFRPLGMRQSSFTSLDGSAVDPATGARSSASDLIRFMTMLLNNGVYKGQRILSEEAIKELRKIHADASLNNAPAEVSGFQYALGAWSPEQKGKEAAVLTAPSLGGTIAVIDFCRGYAYVYLLKTLSDDQKANAYSNIKAALDEKFSGSCE